MAWLLNFRGGALEAAPSETNGADSSRRQACIDRLDQGGNGPTMHVIEG